MNITITLLIYWSVAIALVTGGIYALRQGFKLVREGQGKTKEKSTIEFGWFSATVSSLGSLVMITAFLWGYAATLALPDYEDSDVKIAQLQKVLEETKEELALRERTILAVKKDLDNAESYMKSLNVKDIEKGKALSMMEQEIGQAQRSINAHSNYEDEVRAIKRNLERQRATLSNLERLIKEEDKEEALKKIKLLKELTEDLRIAYGSPE